MESCRGNFMYSFSCSVGDTKGATSSTIVRTVDSILAHEKTFQKEYGLSVFVVLCL